jgi:hypothetical protein
MKQFLESSRAFSSSLAPRWQIRLLAITIKISRFRWAAKAVDVCRSSHYIGTGLCGLYDRNIPRKGIYWCFLTCLRVTENRKRVVGLTRLLNIARVKKRQLGSACRATGALARAVNDSIVWTAHLGRYRKTRLPRAQAREGPAAFGYFWLYRGTWPSWETIEGSLRRCVAPVAELSTSLNPRETGQHETHFLAHFRPLIIRKSKSRTHTAKRFDDALPSGSLKRPRG